MRAPNSLLRPMFASVLGFAVLASTAAAARSASPDPSPSAGYRPDTYRAPPVARAPSREAPARVVVVPHTTTVVVQAPERSARQVRRAKRVHRPPPKPAPTPVVRIPDHPAPRFVALAASPIRAEPHVSPALAAALGAFVLFSAMFLVGASRAVQAR